MKKSPVNKGSSVPNLDLAVEKRLEFDATMEVIEFARSRRWTSSSYSTVVGYGDINDTFPSGNQRMTLFDWLSLEVLTKEHFSGSRIKEGKEKVVYWNITEIKCEKVGLKLDFESLTEVRANKVDLLDLINARIEYGQIQLQRTCPRYITWRELGWGSSNVCSMESLNVPEQWTTWVDGYPCQCVVTVAYTKGSHDVTRLFKFPPFNCIIVTSPFIHVPDSLT